MCTKRKMKAGAKEIWQKRQGLFVLFQFSNAWLGVLLNSLLIVELRTSSEAAKTAVLMTDDASWLTCSQETQV